MPAIFASINEQVNTTQPSRINIEDIKTSLLYNERTFSYNDSKSERSVDKKVEDIFGKRNELVVIEIKDATICIFPKAQAKLGLIKENDQLDDFISQKCSEEIQKSVEYLVQKDMFLEQFGTNIRSHNVPHNELDFLNSGVLFFSNKREPKKKISDEEYYGKPSKENLERVRDVLENTVWR